MIFDFLQFLQLGLFVKLFFVVLTFFYIVFCLVIYRQIYLMTKVLDSKISPLVQMIALIQTVGAVIIFLLGIILA